MPEEGKNILKFNQVKKSWKTPFIIYADRKSLVEKILHVVTIRKKLPQQK